MKNNVFIFVCCLFCVVQCTDFKLPAYITKCPRNQNFNKCLKDLIPVILPQLAGGVPEINLPEFDPYRNRETKIDYHADQVRIKAIFKNLTLVGQSTVEIRKVRSEFRDEEVKIILDILIPNVLMQSKFRGEGKVYAVVLGNRGYFNASLHDITDSWALTAKKIEKDGQVYIKCTNFTMNPKIRHVKPYLTDIFPGNDELNNISREFVNSNWQIIYNAVLPIAFRGWSKVMKDYVNRIFLNVPYDELIPIE